METGGDWAFPVRRLERPAKGKCGAAVISARSLLELNIP